MATTEAYLTFLLQQLEGISGISSKKMFGEYLIYCTGKPVLTVCDNTVFVKPQRAARRTAAGNLPVSRRPGRPLRRASACRGTQSAIRSRPGFEHI